MDEIFTDVTLRQEGRKKPKLKPFSAWLINKGKDFSPS